jgi:hypothetical protein
MMTILNALNAIHSHGVTLFHQRIVLKYDIGLLQEDALCTNPACNRPICQIEYYLLM